MGNIKAMNDLAERKHYIQTINGPGTKPWGTPQ